METLNESISLRSQLRMTTKQRKTKHEKRNTKNEKRTTKNEQRKTENGYQKTMNDAQQQKRKKTMITMWRRPKRHAKLFRTHTLYGS